ncbi:MAG: extracellular solute-binding protein [Actinobacteria bacterium]|nr:extracellular solute-binding protein [Actinomycetota bacterium]
MRTALLALPAAFALAVALAACGSTHNTATAPAPAEPGAPATGSLRTFTYEDTVAPHLLDPFKEANPDLDLKTATFDSDSEAAAKLVGGFQADVVEACADEIDPLSEQHLLRPLDKAALPGFDRLAFHDAPGVVDEEGQVLFVPVSAGPQGLIVDTEKVKNVNRSWKALFEPQYKGEVAIEGDESLTPLGEAALAMGFKKPMELTSRQIEEVTAFLKEHRSQFRSYTESDSDTINLLKSGEIVLADGGRGTAIAAEEAGIPVEWIAPREGPLSWICGLGIPSSSENVDAAYKLINYYTSPKAQAQSALEGYVVTNPAALPLVPAKYKESADPASVANAIPEREPSNLEEYVHAWQEVQSE